jgi:rubrerythrin
METRTRENLFVALHGEAFAFARYKLMAARALEGGDADLAEMLEGIAAVELHEHFAELAELAELVGPDEENLVTAIQDENAEVEETYRVFAEEAQAAGETAVAARFEEIRRDELEHVHTLETALERLELPA